MQWTPPDFHEISLSGEVTAYVNTDDGVIVPTVLEAAPSHSQPSHSQPSQSAPAPCHTFA